MALGMTYFCDGFQFVNIEYRLTQRNLRLMEDPGALCYHNIVILAVAP